MGRRNDPEMDNAMNDPLNVRAGERGVVRIFTTALEPEGDAAITAGNVAKLLGKNISLDARKVEVFPAKVIEILGLQTYLREGYGIPEESMAGKAAVLDALKGLVILVPSSAFEGQGVYLNPNPALRFIAAFEEVKSPPPVGMAHSEAAEGVVAPRGASRAYREAERHFKWWMVALGALALSGALVLFFVI